MKKTGWMLLFLAAMSATGAASAQSRYFDSNYGAQMRDNRPDPRGGGYQNDPRQNADRAREEQAQRRGNDRMSPDERRALRQQIDEAGRDIYRRR